MSTTIKILFPIGEQLNKDLHLNVGLFFIPKI
jgi:hypothetical protein